MLLWLELQADSPVVSASSSSQPGAEQSGAEGAQDLPAGRLDCYLPTGKCPLGVSLNFNGSQEENSSDKVSRGTRGPEPSACVVSV